MIRYIALFMIIILLTGCWDIEESDRLDYVHGIGIDYDDGLVTVYLQIVNLGNLGQSEGGSAGEGTQAVVAKATGESVNNAIFEIYKSAQRRLFWGHLTFLLVTDEALKHHKVNDAIDVVDRYRETRYRTKIFATNDKDLDKLLEAAPIFNGSPVFNRLTDLNNVYGQSSWIKELSMREFLIALDEPSHYVMIPAVTTSQGSWRSGKEEQLMVQMEGVAVTTKNHFHGFILGKDIDGLRWMSEDTKRDNITIYNDGKQAAGMIVLNPNVSYDIRVEGKDVTFHVTIKAATVVNEQLMNIDKETTIKEVEKTIRKEVMQTYEKALEKNIDVYRLSERLYRRELNTWKKIEKKGMIPLHKDSLQVDVEIELKESKLHKQEPVVN